MLTDSTVESWGTTRFRLEPILMRLAVITGTLTDLAKGSICRNSLISVAPHPITNSLLRRRNRQWATSNRGCADLAGQPRKR
jgi:hypothetical protein